MGCLLWQDPSSIMIVVVSDQLSGDDTYYTRDAYVNRPLEPSACPEPGRRQLEGQMTATSSRGAAARFDHLSVPVVFRHSDYARARVLSEDGGPVADDTAQDIPEGVQVKMEALLMPPPLPSAMAWASSSETSSPESTRTSSASGTSSVGSSPSVTATVVSATATLVPPSASTSASGTQLYSRFEQLAAMAFAYQQAQQCGDANRAASALSAIVRGGSTTITGMNDVFNPFIDTASSTANVPPFDVSIVFPDVPTVQRLDGAAGAPCPSSSSTATASSSRTASVTPSAVSRTGPPMPSETASASGSGAPGGAWSTDLPFNNAASAHPDAPASPTGHYVAIGVSLVAAASIAAVVAYRNRRYFASGAGGKGGKGASGKRSADEGEERGGVSSTRGGADGGATVVTRTNMLLLAQVGSGGRKKGPIASEAARAKAAARQLTSRGLDSRAERGLGSRNTNSTVSPSALSDEGSFSPNDALGTAGGKKSANPFRKAIKLRRPTGVYTPSESVSPRDGGRHLPVIAEAGIEPGGTITVESDAGTSGAREHRSASLTGLPSILPQLPGGWRGTRRASISNPLAVAKELAGLKVSGEQMAPGEGAAHAANGAPAYAATPPHRRPSSSSKITAAGRLLARFLQPLPVSVPAGAGSGDTALGNPLSATRPGSGSIGAGTGLSFLESSRPAAPQAGSVPAAAPRVLTPLPPPLARGRLTKVKASEGGVTNPFRKQVSNVSSALQATNLTTAINLLNTEPVQAVITGGASETPAADALRSGELTTAPRRAASVVKPGSAGQQARLPNIMSLIVQSNPLAAPAASPALTTTEVRILAEPQAGLAATGVSASAGKSGGRLRKIAVSPGQAPPIAGAMVAEISLTTKNAARGSLHVRPLVLTRRSPGRSNGVPAPARGAPPVTADAAAATAGAEISPVPVLPGPASLPPKRARSVVAKLKAAQGSEDDESADQQYT